MVESITNPFVATMIPRPVPSNGERMVTSGKAVKPWREHGGGLQQTSH